MIFHIYAIYGMQQILLNFVFMYIVFKFLFSSAFQNYMQKWPIFMQISWKKSDLNFLFMSNFVQKKIIYFEWMCNFVQNWFHIDTQMMQNFMQKSHFMQNHGTDAQENWVFWGNPKGNPLNKTKLRALGSHEFSKQNFKQIGLRVHAFWSNIQLNKPDRQKNKQNIRKFLLNFVSGFGEKTVWRIIILK